MLKDKLILNSMERTCAECGKQFTIQRMDLWTYKLSIQGGKTAWFCRYNCWRASQKKHEDEKAGRKTELKANPNKPTKGALETDLRSDLPIVQIAKKYEASVQTIHNWIKSYELSGIQGQKKPFDRPVVAPKICEKPILEEMVQVSPTLTQIEQFHTDEPVQELPNVEFDPPSHFIADQKEILPDGSSSWSSGIWAHCSTGREEFTLPETPEPKTVPTLDELLGDVEGSLAALRIRYVEQADNEFRAQLLQLVLAVTNGRGLVG